MSTKSKQTDQPETETVLSPGQDGGEYPEEGNVVVWITRAGRRVKRPRTYEVHIIDIDDMECDVPVDVSPCVFHIPGGNPKLPGVGLPFVVLPPSAGSLTPPSPPALIQSGS